MLLPPLQGRSSGIVRLDTLARNATVNPDIELEDITPRLITSSSPATIHLRNLTLSWSDEDSPLIDDVSFDFQPGDLTLIVGPDGCGKSSLLRDLLGESPLSKGAVCVDRAHAAFIDQVPRIQNSNVRNNITGVSVFEPEWYAKVVHACAFDRHRNTF